MSMINYASREINCKIVYYGPGLGGKTTNLEIVYGGDGNDVGSMLTPPKLTQSALKSLARPMVAFSRRGPARS